MSKRKRSRMGADEFRQRIMSVPIPASLGAALGLPDLLRHQYMSNPAVPQPPQVSGEDRRRYALSCAMALALNDRITAGEVVGIAQLIEFYLGGDR